MSTKSKVKATKSPNKIIAFFKSNKLRYSLVVTLSVIAIYLLVAFSSFLFTGAFDQSKLHVSTEQLLENPELGVQNNAGQTGANLSYLFINQGFGIASFLFIFIITVIVFQLLRLHFFNYWKSIFLSLWGIFWLSTFLGLVTPYAHDGFHIAGSTGLYMANVMCAKFGFPGSLSILLGLLVITLILAFDQFIPWVGKLKRTLFPEKKASNFKTKTTATHRNLASMAEDDEEEEYESNQSQEEEVGEFNEFEKDEEKETLEEEHIDIDQLDLDDDKILEVTEEDVTIFELENDEEEEIDEDDEEEEEETPEIYQTPAPTPTPKAMPESPIAAPTAPTETEIPANGDDLGIIVEKKSEEEVVTANASVANLNEAYDPTLDLSNYKFPTIDLLEEHQGEKHDVSEEELVENKNKIVETLRHYKIEIVKIRATIGPTITLYEIVPAPGTRVNKIKNLEDDIALSLAALGVRIIAPIPGKGTIGIEVPNKKPEIVSMRSIVASKKFQESKAELPVVMGKTITNETFVFDLTKMPHLLVAGATGQGKSVGLNAIITSLLYKKHPSQLKMVMVDPKMVELNIYGVIEKHFLAKLPDADKPIITDVDKVKNTLNSLTIEMDERYKLLMKANARNIKEYNTKFTARRLNPNNGHKYLPYIVVVVDEFADLIMTAGKEIETPIARIAQKARAVGIHMIIATQRPSTNIITGVIKANFPGRVAFRVASMIDSRTILDTPGANQLIGKGDMLFMQGSDMTRLQCAFVDTPEVERVCEFISDQQGYPTAFLLPEYVPESDGSGIDLDLNQKDELFEDVARMVVSNQMGSTSMIQRKFSIGYNRAGRLMDQLEAAGVVGPSEGSKPRQVLMQDDYALEQLLNNL